MMDSQQATTSSRKDASSAATALKLSLSWIAITIGFRHSDGDNEQDVEDNNALLLTPEYLTPQREGKNKDGTVQKNEDGKVVYHYLDEDQLTTERTVKYSTRANKLRELKVPEQNLINKLKTFLNRSEDGQEQAVWYHGKTSKHDTCEYGNQPHLHVLMKPTGDLWAEKKWTQFVQQANKLHGVCKVFKIKRVNAYIKKLKTEDFYFLGASTQNLLDTWMKAPEAEDKTFIDFSEPLEGPSSEAGQFVVFDRKFGKRKGTSLDYSKEKKKKKIPMNVDMPALLDVEGVIEMLCQ